MTPSARTPEPASPDTPTATSDANHEIQKTPRIVLLRHGETEWSRSGKHTSVTDLALTTAGETQARTLGAALHQHRFGLVLSSPRRRAVHTAELAGFGDRATVDENLAEWDYGAYEGLTTAEITAQLGHPWNLWDDGVPAGGTPGESSVDVQRRARAVLARCRPVLDAGEDVLLVAHGHMLRGIAIAWIGLPSHDGDTFALWTGTISELGFEHGRQVIVRWNSPPDDLAEL